MIEVEMVDDIRKYEPKLIGPFTKRQIICACISAVYSVPIAFFLPVTTGDKITYGILMAIPVILCGWIKMDGAPLEVIMMRMIYTYFLTPPKRKYESTCEMKRIRNELLKKEENKKVSQMTKKERKKYEKEKMVTYSTKPEFKAYK